jgi:hypothetical protein
LVVTPSPEAALDMGAAAEPGAGAGAELVVAAVSLLLHAARAITATAAIPIPATPRIFFTENHSIQFGTTPVNSFVKRYSPPEWDGIADFSI